MTDLTTRKFRLGTRGSPLAVAQANIVRDCLIKAHGLDPAQIEIVVIKTTGDIVLDRPLSEIGGKGLFTKELERALYDGDIDFAVHSMKDVATDLPDGLEIAAILPREDVRDAFISLTCQSVADLVEGAVVGTSSLRRRAQLLAMRPDLSVVEFRGNVQTRLKKLEDNVAAASFLAIAGLHRLGRHDLFESGRASVIETTAMLPACAQGAIGIELRADDEVTRTLVVPLDDRDTHDALLAERAFLRGLDGSCRTPIAGLATIEGGTLHLRGEVIAPDGRDMRKGAWQGARQDAELIGQKAAEELVSRGAKALFNVTDPR